MKALASKLVPRWSIEAVVTAAFIGALILMCMVTSLAWYSVTQFLESTRWVDHTHVVLVTLEHANASSEQALSLAQEYVITGDPTSIAGRDRAISDIESSVRELGELTADNRAQQERLAILNSRAAERIAFMNAVVIMRQTEGFEAAQRLIASGRPHGLVNQLRESVNGMADEERLLLRQRLLAAWPSRNQTRPFPQPGR